MMVSDSPLYTRWGKQLDKNNILSEYPRPQFRRGSYLNLNGVWSYAIVKEQECPESFDGEILVPFSPESPLSGVGCQLLPNEYLFYRRFFTLPEGFNCGRVLMHFGAVDQEARVSVNGVEVGTHVGGFLPFSLDITDAVKDGENTVLVRVRDVSDTMYYARGKQKLQRGGIFYTAQSGIWQTVWLESVPQDYITHLKLTPMYDDGCIRIETQASGDAETEIEIYDGAQKITGAVGADVTVRLENFKSWSPESPFLYDLKLKHGTDSVDSYFAMRKISLGKNEYGYPCMLLNNKPYFHNGLLDQGYYSDGYLTPPSDEAMIHDIQTAKDLGFNMLRKHIKIEPMRWYYHCDRLGMLVWQDMVNGGEHETFYWTGVTGFLHWKMDDTAEKNYKHAGRLNAAGREMYTRETCETVELLYNVPSIVLWVPFNEGWGQFNAKDAYRLVKSLDPTRLIDHASGWQDQGIGDFNSRHIYFTPIHSKLDDRPFILSEFGGLGVRAPGHMFTKKIFCYKMYKTKEKITAAYRRLYEKKIIPYTKKGMAASVYTQLTDVEEEINGMMTYDREELKIDADTIRELNAKCRF